MKRKKVISANNRKTNPFSMLYPAATVWLLLDRFHAAQWAYGAFFLFYGLAFVILFMESRYEDEVDIFEKDGK